ncbi:nucleotide disphospho-sugar-binding domain-containing protein [Spirillospora sp. NPDC052269]
MRVLFLSTPLESHLYPMVPLAWALRAAGHEVVVGTTGPALSVAGAGLDVVDLDPEGRRPSVASLNATRPDLVGKRATKVADGRPLLVEATRAYADDMIATARLWRPDLVVHSQLQGGGPLAAAAVGVPSVEHATSLLRTDDFYERLPDLLPEVFTAHGLDGLPARRGWIDVAPPSMAGRRPGTWSMRYIPYNGGGLLPSGLAGRPDGRRVAVTVGTGVMAPNADRLLSRVLKVAEETDAEFVLLLGAGADTGGLGDPPPNVRAVREWVPLRALLDTCDALVHHGGAGSTLAALDAGVAQVVIPSGAPNYIQAASVRDRGVGLTTDVDDLDAALVERALTDARLLATVREVRAEMAALPSPADTVARLTDLAGLPVARERT